MQGHDSRTAFRVVVVAMLAAAMPARAAVARPQEGPPNFAADRPAVPAALAPVLERAGRYVLDYEQAFGDLAADEEYVQSILMGDQGRIVKPIEGPARDLSLTCTIKPWCRLLTRADVVFVRRSDGAGWSSFRDVYQLDDEKVRDREPRLEQLFSNFSAAEAERRAGGLLLESDARYNVGPCLRNLNEPTLGLALLHPENQPRFAWKQTGKGRVDGVDAVAVTFEGVATPPLLARSDGEPLPITGRLWIDAAHGTLLRSELEFRLAPRSARARVAVEYRMDRALGIRVPAERREEYEDLPGGQPVFGPPAKATATFSTWRRFTRAAGVAAATPSLVAPEAERRAARAYGPELTQALQRAGDYVAEYERGFSDLVVEETYAQDLEVVVQRIEGSGPVLFGEAGRDGGALPQRSAPVRQEKSHKRQTTRADLVFVRLAGEFPWASYRDIFELNGRQVRDHEQRLVELFSTPSPDVHAQADRLLAASAAYNIGPVRRTVNLPTLPLVFLLPDKQSRFEFRLGERRTIAGTAAVELLFRETSRPTLVKGPRGLDLPAKGRFWVSPTRGTVVRSEVDFDFGPEARARVSADYQPEPALAMWVPSEMREEYSDAPRAKVRTFPNAFKGVARYDKFRRFTVRSEEAAVAPAP